MSKIYLILLLPFSLCLVIGDLAAQNQKNILFVGNSLTYYNNMPQTLQKMVDESGLNITIDQSTKPGFTLGQHAKYTIDTLGNMEEATDGLIPPTVDKIISKNWDVVVLQEATAFMLNEPQRSVYCEPAIFYLDSIIKTKGGKTILYEGYAAPGKDSFPKQHCQLWLNMFYFNTSEHKKLFTTKEFIERVKDSLVCTDFFHNSAEEEIELQLEYNRIAKKIGAFVAPVGYAFELCKVKYPSISLFDSTDNFHPSRQGSYLIACVFYKFLTGLPLNKIKYSADVNEVEAREVRYLVDLVPMGY